MWDILQHFQIEKARTAAELASIKVDQLNARRDGTREDLDRLTLACQAMWELLSDHLGFTDDHLRATILEIDVRDGRVDGKISPMVVTCPQCGKNTRDTGNGCMYCGQHLPSHHAMT
jgi:hypothetical protein